MKSRLLMMELVHCNIQYTGKCATCVKRAFLKHMLNVTMFNA